MPSLWAHFLAVWRLLPSPQSQVLPSLQHLLGMGRAGHNPGRIPSLPAPWSMAVHLVSSRAVVWQLVHGCSHPSGRHGVVHSALAREEGCCLGEVRRGWRGSGTPALPSLLVLLWFSSSVLGFDRVSLSLHISPSLLPILGCVYRSARAASKREPPWAAARRDVPTPTTTRVPSTQVRLATEMGHRVVASLTQLNVGSLAPGLGVGLLLARVVMPTVPVALAGATSLSGLI